MRIYVICPVRNADPETLAMIERHVASTEAAGHEVHFPPRDVDQDDPTGERICREHLAAMKLADEVHVFWDAKSSGSHFDLGMAWALGKRCVPVHLFQPDGQGKSYVKVMQSMQGGDYAPQPERLAFLKEETAAG